jgi:hypothetical protein
MKLLTEEIRKQLLRNGAVRREAEERNPWDGATPDFFPVVKLFTPDAGATWLLTELDPDDPDRAFGLCDLGMGMPELGYVSITELESVRGPLRLPIERDIWFRPEKTIAAYAEEARARGRITA